MQSFERTRSARAVGPEHLLALWLSAPPEQSDAGVPSVTIDFKADETVARIRPARQGARLRLLASKDTIAFAIMLLQVIERRGPDVEPIIHDALGEYAVTSARGGANRTSRLVASFSFSDEGPTELGTLLSRLDLSDSHVAAARERATDVLTELEDRGLVIDPAFVPGLMVLAGLVPLQFSIRTRRGERRLRELTVRAPVWSLRVKRGAQTEIDFKLRGVTFIRSALQHMAREFLAAEDLDRIERGKPRQDRQEDPELDD